MILTGKDCEERPKDRMLECEVVLARALRVPLPFQYMCFADFLVLRAAEKLKCPKIGGRFRETLN